MRPRPPCPAAPAPARAWATLGLLLALTMMLSGCCKPKPGDSCHKGQAACLDPRTELSCQASKFISAPCKGPGGCALQGGLVSCDISGNGSGDICSSDDEGKAACTADSRARVQCVSGTYQLLPCRGEGACRSEPTGVLCDTSIAQIGDPCDPPPPGKDNHACGAGPASVLACKNGRFAAEQLCRGPDGCKVKGGIPLCDMSIAAEGDGCGAEIAGKHACSLDMRSLLRCQGGKFLIESPCRGTRGCVLEADRVACD